MSDQSRFGPVILFLVIAFCAMVPHPVAASDEVSSLLFGSCNRQDKDQSYWETLRAQEADLVLMIGDNIYGDDEAPGLPRLKRAYDQLAATPGFMALEEAQPRFHAVWDDHDFGRNDGGGDYPHKAESERLFETFWGYGPDSGPGQVEGIYQVLNYGEPGKRLQVILLDTRYFRTPLVKRPRGGARPGKFSPQTDPEAQMLGETQWAWLEDVLKEPADLRIVVSSIQVIAEGHDWERWGNMPGQQARLYDTLAGASGRVLLLSGDRHRGGFYEREIGDKVLAELTSSSLNHSFPGDEPGPYRVQGMFGENNFGTVRIDWGQRKVVMSLHKTEDGSVLGEQVYGF